MKNHYKLWTIISLIIVFSAGLIGGVLLDKHIFNKKHKSQDERTDRKKTSSTRFPTLDIMAKELGLSTEQKEKIQEIFKNNEERFKTLRKDMNERLMDIRIQLNNEIKSVLTEEQQAKYEAMIKKYHSQRKREIDKRNKHSEGQNKGERR
jgi:Spy/CpxP family protein refolding chaperone